MSTTTNLALEWQPEVGVGNVTEVPPDSAGWGQGGQPCPFSIPVVIPVVIRELFLGLVGARSAAVTSCPSPSPQGSFFGFCSSAENHFC